MDRLIIEPVLLIQKDDGVKTNMTIDGFCNSIGFKNGDFLMNIKRLFRYNSYYNDLKLSFIDFEGNIRVCIETNSLNEKDGFDFDEFYLFINGKHHYIQIKPLQFTKTIRRQNVSS